MTLTDLDQAHAAMEAAPEDDAARLRFFERLADTELFLLLSAEAVGDQIDPETFDVEGQSFVLIFDREERLADFVGAKAPYAALSGRVLFGMLAGQSVGFALNPDVAPSSMLLAADGVDWLVDVLGNAPELSTGTPVEVAAPRGLPEALLLGLDRKLAMAGGLARQAYLAAVTYETGAKGHLLAFIATEPGAESALAAAVGEALTFSGVEAGMLDVAFLAPSDAVAAQLAKVGLRFDLPKPVQPEGPKAPGMDPESPPRLR